MTYYQADGWIKLSEEDHYLEGCDPNTAQHHGGNERWTSETVEGLILQLLDFTGADPDALDLDACDDIGRVDIIVLEDENSYTATSKQIAQWHEGEVRLWSSIYSFRVLKMNAEPVSLYGVIV